MIKFRVVKPILLCPVQVGNEWHRTSLSHGPGIHQGILVDEDEGFIRVRMEFTRPNGHDLIGVVELARDAVELVEY